MNRQKRALKNIKSSFFFTIRQKEKLAPDEASIQKLGLKMPYYDLCNIKVNQVI
jgi:hypothetical protein